MTLLLDHGANIEARCGDWGTPLMFADVHRETAAVKLLIERGADVRGDNRRVLCRAAFDGNVELITMLLDHGADIEARCDNLRTPLLEAALWGNTAAVKRLLERGADVTATEDRGFNAEHVAWRRSHRETTQLIHDWIATHPSSSQ